jgi:hypothetical protein
MKSNANFNRRNSQRRNSTRNNVNHVKVNKKKQTDGIDTMSNKLTKIPRTIAIMPDRYYCLMRYTDFSADTIGATGQFFNRRFRPTNAFDIDPLLGGTSMPGFIEFSALYASYRVTWSKCRVRISPGGGALPTLITLVPLNIDLGSSPSVAALTSLPDQAYAKSKVAGAIGSPTITLETEMSTEKIYGSKAVYFDDSFSSVVTGGPANNWFWNISGLITSAASAASTFYVETSLDVGIEFFDRKQLQN